MASGKALIAPWGTRSHGQMACISTLPGRSLLRTQKAQVVAQRQAKR
jgi:hypothetical protein